MNPVMYLFLNRGLGMSTGKSAAQTAHAAVEAFQVSDPEMIKAWNSGGHYTKIVLMAEDETQLSNIQHYLNERGFKTRIIIDEGRTEIKAFTKTALGVEIVDKDDLHVKDSFSEFKTYKDLPKPWTDTEFKIAYDLVGAHGHLNRKGESIRKNMK